MLDFAPNLEESYSRCSSVFSRIALLTDREERSVVCTCAVNLSAQSSALRVATAFSKGNVCAPHASCLSVTVFR